MSTNPLPYHLFICRTKRPPVRRAWWIDRCVYQTLNLLQAMHYFTENFRCWYQNRPNSVSGWPIGWSRIGSSRCASKHLHRSWDFLLSPPKTAWSSHRGRQKRRKGCVKIKLNEAQSFQSVNFRFKNWRRTKFWWSTLVRCRAEVASLLWRQIWRRSR